MDRRHLLLAGAAAFAGISPALAQSRGPAPGSAESLSPTESKYIGDTMRIGSLSLATSRIAAQKAQNAAVKEFAQFEVAEQETVAEVLKSMQGANVTTGQGAAPNAQVADQLDDKGKTTLKKLQDAKSGAAFDKEYLQVQVEGHKELLKIQESYIGSGRVREAVNVAKLARGMIKEHLKLLDDATGKIGRG